jgi:hypothetical protein
MTARSAEHHAQQFTAGRSGRGLLKRAKTDEHERRSIYSEILKEQKGGMSVRVLQCVCM